MHVQIQEGWFLYFFFFFLPSIILFWQFNQFCRLCNYLNRKPPGPSRPPCRCSWRVTLLLMEHFFHPHPGGSCRMSGWTLLGHLGPAALPGVDVQTRPWQSSPWESRLMAASPNFLPVSKLGKNFSEAGCVHRAGRVCSQEPLAGFLKGA